MEENFVEELKHLKIQNWISPKTTHPKPHSGFKDNLMVHSLNCDTENLLAEPIKEYLWDLKLTEFTKSKIYTRWIRISEIREVSLSWCKKKNENSSDSRERLCKVSSWGTSNSTPKNFLNSTSQTEDIKIMDRQVGSAPSCHGAEHRAQAVEGLMGPESRVCVEAWSSTPIWTKCALPCSHARAQTLTHPCSRTCWGHNRFNCTSPQVHLPMAGCEPRQFSMESRERTCCTQGPTQWPEEHLLVSMPGTVGVGVLSAGLWKESVVSVPSCRKPYR